MSAIRSSVLLAVGVGLVLVATSADAERPFRSPRPSPSFRVTLEDEEGAPLPAYRHEGRTFVLGEEGARYAIRISNPTSTRVEAVISVDGRDAVSGRIGDYHGQRGYIVPAYGSIRVEGFRRSLEEIAAFRFSNPEQSYSARLGTPENVGVIGVAFFSEQLYYRREEPRLSQPARPVPAEDDVERDGSAEARARQHSDTPRPSPSAAKKTASAPPSRGRAESPHAARAPESASESSRRTDVAPRDSVDNLGTEYGERRDSSVVEVTFRRRSPDPDRIVSIRYDDADGLRARGIDLTPRTRRMREPEPFPGSRFASPPP